MVQYFICTRETCRKSNNLEVVVGQDMRVELSYGGCFNAEVLPHVMSISRRWVFGHETGEVYVGICVRVDFYPFPKKLLRNAVNLMVVLLPIGVCMPSSTWFY